MSGMALAGVSRFVLHALLAILSLLFIVPFVLILSISFSNQAWLDAHGFSIWPHEFTLTAYRYIFQVPATFFHAYLITIIITVVGTVASLFLVALIGYVISRPDYAYRGITTMYIYFTMLFSGGLVPFYLLMTKYLHLGNTIWSMIVPGLISPFYVLVMKGFLSKLPFEMIEAAKIDGASEWRIFIQIALPLATPALATIGVFTSFGYWTEWYNALLFTTDPNLQPVQLLLYHIFDDLQIIASNPEAAAQLHLTYANTPTTSLEMALVVLVAGPIMVAFPFFRRYYVQGLTVGSIKG